MKYTSFSIETIHSTRRMNRLVNILVGAGVGTFMLGALFALSPSNTHAQFNGTPTDGVSVRAGAVVGDDDITTHVAATSSEREFDGNEAKTEDGGTNGVGYSSGLGGSFETNDSGLSVVSSAQVASEADLKVFSSNMPIEREGVDKVNIESKNDGGYDVRVVYRHTGKLLGFIPITIKSTTVVESSASTEREVHSGLPWWSFLVTGETYARDDVESRVKGNATIASTVAVNATPQEKARVAEAIIAEVSADASL